MVSSVTTEVLPTEIEVIDSHTGGEPTRVILSGWPDIPGNSLEDQLVTLKGEFDYLRRAVICEPHGHDAIVGALVQDSSSSEVIASVIFFNDVGYLGMCGHGMIGTVKTLQHLGKIDSPTAKLETPAGIITATIHDDDLIEIGNVPAYLYQDSVEIDVAGIGKVTGDIAYGGNWFFLVNSIQEDLTLSNLDKLLYMTKAIREGLEIQDITGKDGAYIDHIELFSNPINPEANSRNFVLCPGNAYDRSPCGTGTSAKMAALYAKGNLNIGEPWTQESITGSIFHGRLELVNDAIIPYIKSSAHLTAKSTLVFDPKDDFRWGI